MVYRRMLLGVSVLSLGCGVPARQMPSVPVAVPAAASAPVPQPARPTAPARAMPLPNLAGQWEFSFTPDAQSGDLAGTPQANLAEINLQQNANYVYIDATGVELFMLSEYPGPTFQQGSQCIEKEIGNITGTISDDGLSFQLTVSGPIANGDTAQEEANTTGAVNQDGTLTGTYSGNNVGLSGCPFNSTGTFSGTPITTQFSGTYQGELANDDIDSMETVSMTFSQSGSTLNITGSDNGTPFSLSGVVMGSFFQTSTFDGYLPLNDPRIWLWDEESGDRGVLEVQQ